MSGPNTSDQVPGKYDVIVDGYGYVFWNGLMQSLPFRNQRAAYSYSPTFIERTNVSGSYGDNDQDFFLTESQDDWSLGEEQKYFRNTDADRVRRYFLGQNIDPVTVPGQVTLRNSVSTLTFGGAVCAVAETNVGTPGVYAASSTHLYFVAADGTITDEGTHGLGATPSQWGLTTDGANVYVSTTGSGTVGVRKWDGSSFTTFSATGADSLAFLNNILFGYQSSTGRLIQYSTSGTATTLFTWQDAAGNALTGSSYLSRLRPYGGQLYILRPMGVRGRGELWQFDGSGTSQLAEVPLANFVAKDMEVAAGVVFISGYLSRNGTYAPAIVWDANSTIDLLWKTQTTGYANPTWPALAAYGDGVAFTDDSAGRLLGYSLSVGGVHTMGTYTVTNATPMMAASRDVLVHTRNSTTGYLFPSSSVASSGYVVSSLIDFENSLTKTFRGVKVQFDAPTGSSVDIAYQVDSLSGSWTTLQSGATSGTEYLLSGVSGTAIAIKVTLNKGTSSSGPTLKRVYVRAAPVQQSYRRRQYVLDLQGAPTSFGGIKNPVRLRDGTDCALSGAELAANLTAAITSASPVSITDRFGTFTAVFEQGEGVTELDEVRPAEYIAQVTVREV